MESDVKTLQHYIGSVNATFEITGSKSETNRLLILQKNYPNLKIKNISNSDDTALLKRALSSNEKVIDIGHAGTAMRFLTTYFATREGRTVVLTGSPRMQQRPIGILVNALRDLGADITYEKEEGYPPLRIRGKKIKGGAVTMDGSVSSQYISSLLLMAGSFERPLELPFLGEMTSLPYMKMTLSLLAQIGIRYQFDGSKVVVYPQKRVENQEIWVESDWSSASYHYSLVALCDGGRIALSMYKSSSLQGDSVLATIYEKFGVKTQFLERHIILSKRENYVPKAKISLDLSNAPDIAQTVAVTAFGLGMACDLMGLHTLKIKETDRLLALKQELEKLGADIKVTEDRLFLRASKNINEGVTIETYRDHRMAMAFAPLLLKTNLKIADPAVVSKSYPTFWEDFESFQ